MKHLLILLMLTFSLTARAGIWIEPYLGYNIGSYEQTISNAGASNGTFKLKYTDPAYGLKLGYNFIAMVVGFEYQLGTADTEFDSSSTPSVTANTPVTKYDTTSTGVFVGFTGLPLLNFWASYQFDVTWEDSDNDELSGSGYGVGAGFTGLPFLSINLDYKSYTLDESKDGTTGIVTTLPSNQLTEITSKVIMLSVSLPFDL
jgi:hypothetical protein